ncbi:hypothetical protein QFC19_003377 [Naganishia cerealis]|uniref:Uncharacterized protein n=1 Tax=Naganishia cerealis TaxID=610337 RepID=A0ACC2W3L9_9TREE|nr:hypothetical protein QFC19_003377 [Naganishia cerealis]
MSGSGAGVMSGSMAQGIVLSAGTNGGFGAGSREPPQSGITGYGHARTGSRVQHQHQQQGDPSSINAAMTGLGITTYPRHGRSASTSSLSASEPLHGSAARAGGAESYAIGSGSSGGGGAGVGRIIGGTGAHGRHGSSGSSAFGRNSAMGAFAFGGKESTTASTGGIGRAGKDVATTTTSSGSGNGPINEEPSSSTTPTTNNNVPAPPVASSAAFRSSVSGARGTGTTQGLATHHETDSPTGTPTKTSASGSSPNARAGDTAAAAAATAHGQVAGTTEDVGTPGIEILGAVPFPEGGPGGYLASKERRASSGKASGVGEVTVAEVFGNVRRESLDAKSAEKALREVSRALEGLGVGVGVAAAAGKS